MIVVCESSIDGHSLLIDVSTSPKWPLGCKKTKRNLLVATKVAKQEVRFTKSARAVVKIHHTKLQVLKNTCDLQLFRTLVGKYLTSNAINYVTL